MNTLDTRDLYTRKCELEALRDAVEAAREELTDAGFPTGTMRSEIPEEFSHLIKDLDSALEDFGDEEKEELKALEDVENQIGMSAFLHGETLIPERDFKEYARELAEDIGAIPDNAKWPCTCIDWEQAAEELKQDYSSLEYEGKTYYFRS